MTAADDGLAVLWSLGDPAAPAPLRRIKHTGRVYAVAFSPDGRLLADRGPDGLVALWDLRDLARSTPLGQPLRYGRRCAHTVVFAPDGRTILLTGILGGATLWDVADPDRPQHLAPLTQSTPRRTSSSSRTAG